MAAANDFQLMRLVPQRLLERKETLAIRLTKIESLLTERNDLRVILSSRATSETKLTEIEKLLGRADDEGTEEDDQQPSPSRATVGGKTDSSAAGSAPFERPPSKLVGGRPAARPFPMAASPALPPTTDLGGRQQRQSGRKRELSEDTGRKNETWRHSDRCRQILNPSLL